MKSMADLMLALQKISPGFVKAAGFVIAACVLAAAQSPPPAHLPQVYLDADGLAPRSIEELTGTTIVRHYAQAWRDLAEALESGRTDRLGDDFVGFAKDRVMQRIREQNRAGLHVQVVDQGHHLKAVFYSADGSAMQLVDQAQLEIQTFDGNKLLDKQTVPHEYIVLMTPGADRWYVRDLEEAPAKSF